MKTPEQGFNPEQKEQELSPGKRFLNILNELYYLSENERFVKKDFGGEREDTKKWSDILDKLKTQDFPTLDLLKEAITTEINNTTWQKNSRKEVMTAYVEAFADLIRAWQKKE